MTFAVSGASISRHGCSPMIVPREPPRDRAAVAKRPGLQSTSSQNPFKRPSALAPRLLRARRERPHRCAAEKRRQEFSSFDVACHVPLRLGSFMQWREIPRFHRPVCD